MSQHPAPQPAEHDGASRGAASPSRRVHLPNPPAGVPRVSGGESHRRAEQAAERAVSSGSLDAPSIEATTGDLPFEAVREAIADVELAGVAAERLNAQATGAALLEDARRGAEVEQSALAETNSVDGLAVELGHAEEELADAKAEDETARQILAGERPMPDGTSRPGARVNPAATGERQIRREIRLIRMREVLPIAIPLVVEGIAVTFNMHSYLRADDANWLQPAIIAIVTVGILTLAPWLLGRVMNDVAHGADLTLFDRVWLPFVAALWIAAGVTLAVIRVQVDRAEALDKAEEQRRVAISTAQQLGTSGDDIPPVDPAAVFDPLWPTVFWIVVFIGFGAVLILWERSHRNPALAAELETRLRVRLAQSRVAGLFAQLTALNGSVALQADVNELVVAMWDAEPGVIRTLAETDIAIHHESLANASGDPGVPLAIEKHKAERAARRHEREGEL